MEHDHLPTPCIVGKLVVTNPGESNAKIVDLDPECVKKSTVFGLRFEVNWPTKSTESAADAFIGDWIPSLLTKDYWMQVICANPRRRKQVMSPEQAVEALTHQKKHFKYSWLPDGPPSHFKNSWIYKSGEKTLPSSFVTFPKISHCWKNTLMINMYLLDPHQKSEMSHGVKKL